MQRVMMKAAKITAAREVKKNFFGRMPGLDEPLRLLRHLISTSFIFFLVKGLVWLAVFAYLALVGSSS